MQIGAHYRSTQQWIGGIQMNNSVGSDTDFSAYAKVHWYAARGDGIFLCGTNNDPPFAGVIHAENR